MNSRAVIVILVLAATPFPLAASGEEVFVASYNLFNLFDRVDDPANPGDDEYATVSEAKFQTKLKNQARVISAMNGGKGPDVLGLCEIENASVVEALIEKLAPLGREYKLVHQASPDERGIDTAIVYDDAVFNEGGRRFLTVELPGGDTTRNVTEVDLQRDGKSLFVFMNHWPSQNSPESARQAAAEVVRERLDEIQDADSDADIVLLGDFNEHLGEPALDNTLVVVHDADDATGRQFYATTFPLHESVDQGTYVYQNQWETIDHILVSRGLLDDEGFRWKADSTEAPILFPEMLFDPQGAPIPRPNRDFSDHLPITTILIAE